MPHSIHGIQGLEGESEGKVWLEMAPELCGVSGTCEGTSDPFPTFPVLPEELNLGTFCFPEEKRDGIILAVLPLSLEFYSK